MDLFLKDLSGWKRRPFSIKGLDGQAILHDMDFSTVIGELNRKGQEE